MKRILLSLLGLLAAFTLTSCFESETEIVLNKDGSGTITEEILFGAEIVGMMEMMSAQGGGGQNPLADLKDREKALAKAKAYGEGVTLKSLKEVEKDGSKGVQAVYEFKNINAISFNPASSIGDLAPGQEAANAEADTDAVKFNYVDGVLTFKTPPKAPAGPKDAEEGEEIDQNDPETAMMMEMLKGMKVSAKMTFKPGIENTNASFQEGDSITLFEMEFDKVLQNPEGLNAFKSLNAKDRAGVAKKLQEIEGVKVESKEEVTVKLK